MAGGPKAGATISSAGMDAAAWRDRIALLTLGALAVFVALLALSSPAEAQFEKVRLVTDSEHPLALDVADDGRVFYIERFGRLRVWLPSTGNTVDAGTLTVHSGFEEGMLGFALAPDFAQSNKVYIAYSRQPQSSLTNRVARFTMNGNTLNVASEEVIYEWQHQRNNCCHSAGNLEFGSDGSLFIATGDNTGQDPQGYNPTDNRPNMGSYDAQRTSANTNNPNGKLLRIKPNASAPGYTVPAGNLFPAGTPQTLPEIFAMGLRNPYRFNVDPDDPTRILTGEYGPDAGSTNPDRGPQGSVEWNVIDGPGNHGWPQCVRNNVPYAIRDYNTNTTLGWHNCANPTNNSPHNTGLVNLPPAQPAAMWAGYGETDPRFPGLGTGGAAMGGPRYSFDPDSSSQVKFPAQYDGRWFIYEWGRNWIKTLRVNTAGDVQDLQNFENFGFSSPIDLHFGPDGALYVAEWGPEFWGGVNSGIFRVQYVSDGRPRLDPSATPRRGMAPLSVAFNAGATRSDGSPGTNFQFVWSFGDGTPNSTQASPNHVYANPGQYTASVTATDPVSGESHTATVSVRVDDPANACLLSDASDEFTDTALDKNRWNAIQDENPATYALTGGRLVVQTEPGEFGTNPPARNLFLQDGEDADDTWTSETSFTQNLGGGYAQAGLTAWESHSNFIKFNAISDTNNDRVNRVELRSRVNGAFAGNPPDIAVPAGVQDIALRLTREGNTYRGFMKLDDGTWQNFGTVTHTMEAPDFGLFAFGVQASQSYTVSFDHFWFETGGGEPGDCEVPTNGRPAISALTANPTVGLAPLPVDFEVEASDPDGDDLTYSWNFGDGATANSANPGISRTFLAAGTYEVEVTVSDGSLETTETVDVEALSHPDQEAEFRALVFSKTAGFRHGSIAVGHQAIRNLASQHGFQTDHTENADVFTPAILASYDTVVFLSTTGDVLNAGQQEAFEEYIRDGGGFVGIHAASDTEYSWPWYGDLVGAYFLSHPHNQTAAIDVEDPAHPSMTGSPLRYDKHDEWYNFRSPDFANVGNGPYSPRGNVHVLATVDNSTYDPGSGAHPSDHPVIWCQRYDGGRSWYTALGHTNESYGEPRFLQQILGGMQTTSGARANDACGREVVVTPEDKVAPVTTRVVAGDGAFTSPVNVTLSAADVRPIGIGDELENVDVAAQPTSWTPASVSVKTGDTVTFRFDQPAAFFTHDVWLTPPGANRTDSYRVTNGAVSAGGAPKVQTFNRPGSWGFFCSIHLGMDGNVQVDEGYSSGIEYTEYRVTSGGETGGWVRNLNRFDEQPLTTPVTIEGAGMHQLQYRSADGLGNVEAIKSLVFTSTGAEPSPAAKVAISMSPKKRTIAAKRKKTNFKVRLRNSGGAPTGTVRVCVKAPRKRVRVQGAQCFNLSLAAGQSVTKKIGLRIRPPAAGKTVKVTVQANGAAVASVKQTASLRVKR